MQGRIHGGARGARAPGARFWGAPNDGAPKNNLFIKISNCFITKNISFSVKFKLLNIVPETINYKFLVQIPNKLHLSIATST